MISIKKGSVFTFVGLYVLTIPFFNALNVTSYDNAQILGHFGESTTVLYSVFCHVGLFAFEFKIGKANQDTNHDFIGEFSIAYLQQRDLIHHFYRMVYVLAFIIGNSIYCWDFRFTASHFNEIQSCF